MTHEVKYPKRLIEVDLPIKRISAHARREKSIRHGHISTLHIWWARRPLAACRAVICAALWPDPADPLCPQVFREKAADLITAFALKTTSHGKLVDNCSQESMARWLTLAKPENRLDPTNPAHLNVLRFALLDFIADFANWDNSTVPAYLETARLLTQIAHLTLSDFGFAIADLRLDPWSDKFREQIENLKSKIENLPRPLVVDPFAGGGSIPLEALRVGADAFASDLNPVAVLLNKVVLEYIPKYGNAEFRMMNDERKTENDERRMMNDELEDGEKNSSLSIHNSSFSLEYDAARKVAQGLGAHLEHLTSLVEVKGETARLLPVSERTRALFGKEDAQAPTAKRKKSNPQMQLGFMQALERAEEEDGWGSKGAPRLGATILDRIHQAMILFAAGRAEAMKRFLVEEGGGNDPRFWRLAQALSALYPSHTDEKRWVDGVLARKKGLGF